MADLERVDPTEEYFMPHRIYVDIGEANRSDIDGMLSIFNQAFQRENPKLAQLMYRDDHSDEALYYVVKDILNSQLDSQDCEFMVAFDISDGVGPHCECEQPEIDTGNNLHSGIDTNDSQDSESDTENLTFGWISMGGVSDVTRNTYVASELTTYACLEVLAKQARARGENYLSTRDPRVRLLYELETQSRDGQDGHMVSPYLIVNALVLWPNSHEDTEWEMALKLLGWAVSFAQRRMIPIWTQVPLNQMRLFRQVGFREVRSFTLNLDHYSPPGSRPYWGTQDFVQMVYRVAPEAQHAGSFSRDGGERRRRLSF